MSLVPVATDVLVRTSRRLATTTTLALGRSSGHAAGRPDRATDGRRAALLVDPAWEADELVGLAAEIRSRGVRVAAGFATHAHHDHLLWHPDLGTVVPRWAAPEAARIARRQRGRLVSEARLDPERYGGGDHPETVLDLLGRVSALPAPVGGSSADRASLTLPDPDRVLPEVEIVPHEAHAPGSAAVWLPDVAVLVAGDVLSDVELPLVRDEITGTGDVAGYLAGLDRLAPLVARAAVLVPGHGTPTVDAVARWDADRRYLDAVLAGIPADRLDDPRLAAPGAADAHARLIRGVRRSPW